MIRIWLSPVWCTNESTYTIRKEKHSTFPNGFYVSIKRAIQVNIAIMRAFVQLRKFLQSSKVLSRRLKKLVSETKEKFKEHEEQIQPVFEAIKELISEQEKTKRQIGFQALSD